MAYDSKSDLEVRLAEIRLAIATARKAQTVGAGDNTLTRGNLKTLLDEERWVLSQINAIDAQSSGGGSNRIQFGRPE
jgi:hypothetical protein